MSYTETLNKEIEYLEAIIPFSVKACPTNSLAGYVAPETNAAGVGFAIFSQTKRHFLFLFRISLGTYKRLGSDTLQIRASPTSLIKGKYLIVIFFTIFFLHQRI